MKDLGIRTLINGFSALIVVLLIFFSQVPILSWVFVSAVALLAAVAVWEYCRMVRQNGLKPAVTLSVMMAPLIVFAFFFQSLWRSTLFWRLLPFLLFGAALLCYFIYFALKNRAPIKNITSSFFGLIYIALPLGLIISINYFFTLNSTSSSFEGSWWTFYLILITKSADIGGYFIGGRYGKHKLAPMISPNKSYEGAIGGLFLSIGMSLLLIFFGKKFGMVFQDISYVVALFLGMIVAIFGQLGDFAESLLKRDAGIKDSNTLPGVGGLLDMIDSLLFTAPVVYIFLRFFYTL